MKEDLFEKSLGYTRIILTDRKKRKHMLDLKAGGRFSTQFGYIEHDDMAEALNGAIVRTSNGEPFRIFDVTYRDYVMHIKRQAQIIYPKDTAAILMWGDIAPGQKILESGIGQGALSIAVLRALGGTGKLTSYEIREDFAKMSKNFIKSFLGYEPENHDVVIRNIYEGVDGVYDRVLLDIPEPWQVTPHLEKTLVNGGILVSYIPTVLQVKSMVDSLRESRYFDEIETFELILRPWKVEGLSVRPEMWIYNHSAFIVTARKSIAPIPRKTEPQIEETEVVKEIEDSVDSE